MANKKGNRTKRTHSYNTEEGRIKTVKPRNTTPNPPTRRNTKRLPSCGVAITPQTDSQEVVMCRVPLSLVVLEYLHLLLVGLGDACELLHSPVDTLQKGVSRGRHEIGSAGKAGQSSGQQRGRQKAGRRANSQRGEDRMSVGSGYAAHTQPCNHASFSGMEFRTSATPKTNFNLAYRLPTTAPTRGLAGCHPTHKTQTSQGAAKPRSQSGKEGSTAWSHIISSGSHLVLQLVSGFPLSWSMRDTGEGLIWGSAFERMCWHSSSRRKFLASNLPQDVGGEWGGQK